MNRENYGKCWGVIGWQFGFACRNGDGRRSAEPPNRSDLSDMSDLSDLLASAERSEDGADKNICCPQRLAYPSQTPTRYKTTVQVQYRHTAPRATGRKDGGMGEENCGGTTQLSSPNAASRGKVFCKSFRRKAGRFAKILRRIFDHRHTHTAVKSDAPGRTGRGGLGAAEAPKINSHEHKTVASVVALRLCRTSRAQGCRGLRKPPAKSPRA